MEEKRFYELMQVATDEANALISKGMPKPEAMKLVCESLADVVRDYEAGGLGQSPAASIPEAPEVVKEISAKVTPWLWVVSITSFALALLNSSRIAKIYGGWRAGRKAVREGRAP